MRNITYQELIQQLKEQNKMALGRAITIVENNRYGKEELLEYAFHSARENTLILGLTGAAGAGKSTVIDKLIAHFRKKGYTVGVLAIDPSSPYTGGAFLGDRIRMTMHNVDEEVFIRSFGSRGEHGGISVGAKRALYLYKSFGFDIIIVESVGVGQGETDISNYVDVTAVVLAPGNGDGVQLMKAGTQEIADIFVINKADKPDAETLYLQLQATLGMKKENIIKISALKEEGIDTFAELIFQKRNDVVNTSFNMSKKELRIRNEIITEAKQAFEELLLQQADCYIPEIMEGKISPFEAGKELGSRITIKA